MKEPTIDDIARHLRLFETPDEESTMDAAQEWLERHAASIARKLIGLTKATLTFHQPHPGGRILLMLGEHQIGAVFPPVGHPQDRLPWAWRFWLGSMGTTCPEGRAKSELAAKNAILAKAEEWLRKAKLA